MSWRIELDRSHLKMVLRLGLIGVVIVFALGAVIVLSRAMADISRSEETAAIFNVSAKLHHDLLGAVDWRPDGDEVIKEMDPLTREFLTETWLRAWAQFLILSDGEDPVGSAAAGTNTSGLGEYFDASARDAVGSDPDAWLARPLHQIGHDLELTFYHDDGSVAAVTSHASRFVRGYPVNGEIAWYDTTEAYEAIFVFERGNWRVHHWVRTDSQGRWSAEQVMADHLPLAVADYRALTYRASGQTVAEFWEDPDVEAVAADMAAAAELGFTVVRFEIPFEKLGGRDVTAEVLAPAKAVLDAAHAEGLGVTLALLDGRTEHQPLHWDADDDHIRVVAATLGDHPALRLWELATAPDLDVGVERVELSLIHAWLTHISLTLRDADPDTPMAIDWSTGTAATVAPPIADVVSFSTGGDPMTIEPTVSRLREAGDDRPVLISDAGFHTAVGILPGSQTEADQARYYAALLGAVRDAGVAGFSVATLADFDIETVGARAQAEAERLAAEEEAETAAYYEANPAPKTPEPKELGPAVHEAPVLAEVTWPVGPEANLGLVRVDGSPKAAAALFAPGADLGAVPAPALSERLLKPFNIVLLFLLGAGVGGWILLAVWDRNLVRRPRPLRFGLRLAGGLVRVGLGVTTGLLKTVARGAVRLRGRVASREVEGSGTGSTAHIGDRQADQEQVTAIAEPANPGPVEAPKRKGAVRRLMSWLNEPVLPEGDQASGTPGPAAVSATIPTEAAHPGYATPTAGPGPAPAAHPGYATPETIPPAPAPTEAAHPGYATPETTPPTAAPTEALHPGYATPPAGPGPAPGAHPPAHQNHPPSSYPDRQYFQDGTGGPAAYPGQPHDTTNGQPGHAAHPGQPAYHDTPNSHVGQPQVDHGVAPAYPDTSAQGPAQPQPGVPAPTNGHAGHVGQPHDTPNSHVGQPGQPHDTTNSHVGQPGQPHDTTNGQPGHAGHAGQPGLHQPPSPQPAAEQAAGAEHGSLVMVQVDLANLDQALAAFHPAAALADVIRYAPYLVRALHIAAVEFAPTQPVHVHLTNAAPPLVRQIDNVQVKPFVSIWNEVHRSSPPERPPSTATPTVELTVARSHRGNFNLGYGSRGGVAIPAVSLICLEPRPDQAEAGERGSALLSVDTAGIAVPADVYLARLREIIETRDWALE